MERLLETQNKANNNLMIENKKNKASWFKLFRLVIIKISYSFISAFLFLFSIIISVLTISILFFLNLSATNFIINLQYYIMIFYSIFLFIFILLNAIKLFGTQFEDSSFLLLLTKPYTRNVIILTQYAGLIFMNLVFIFINILALLIFGGICGIIMHAVYLNFYIKTILKLFIFCFLFAMLVTVGVVTMLAFTTSQTVFLIFVIFCSLFLLGGLPYSITKINSDNIKIDLDKKGLQYNVSDIKKAILFNNNLKQGLIKYPNLTNAIFNFYSQLTDKELDNIRDQNVVSKRIDFYRTLGFIETNPIVKTFQGTVRAWQPPKFQNKTIEMKITFNSYFKSLPTLINEAGNNKITQDLIAIINDYDQKYNINDFMNSQQNKLPWLLTYSDNIADTYLQILGPAPEPPELLTANDIDKIRLSQDTYKFSFRSEFNKAFNNPVYFLVRATEEYIYQQVHTYRQITTIPVVKDENYAKYNKVANTYQFINTINFIEHWNQIWTYFLGYYGNFWFEALPQSSIDFDNEKNTLFSYPDFKLTLNHNKTINVAKLNYFQNSGATIGSYIGITILLFLFSYLMYNIKIVN